MILSLQLWRNIESSIWFFTRSHKALSDQSMFSMSLILPSLLHHDIKRCPIYWIELYSRLWHVTINYFREEFDISGGILLNSLHISVITSLIKELFQILYLNINYFILLIGNLLKLDHVFQFSMKWIFLSCRNSTICESGNEINTFIYNIKKQ